MDEGKKYNSKNKTIKTKCQMRIYVAIAAAVDDDDDRGVKE